VSAAGGVFVPVNPLLRPRQVAHILADCGVRVLVTSVERHALLRDVLADHKSVEHVVLVGTEPGAGSEHGGVSTVAWGDLSCEPDGPAEAEEPADTADRGGVTDMDMAAILYTSGSTGLPKGVVLSHRNLIVGAESVNAYLGN